MIIRHISIGIHTFQKFIPKPSLHSSWSMNYTTRTHCSICESPLTFTLFPEDGEAYVAHYAVDATEDIATHHKLPFNIYECDTCKLVQTKYLGSLAEIYRLNHADSTGECMRTLHQQTKKLLLEYKDSIHGILEIGSSIGVLADSLLADFQTPYTIIEPCFRGDRTNKRIIDAFYEDVDDTAIEANTLIMSHVFEHFYKPMEILRKIHANPKIKNVCLVFPDLEQYLRDGTSHVLNTEHTFYMSNEYLKVLFAKFGFHCMKEDYFRCHSVTFFFSREHVVEPLLSSFPRNDTRWVELYFDIVRMRVKKIQALAEENPTKDIYLWPASIHTLTCIQFGAPTTIYGLLDNSPNKIGKRVYGYGLPIRSFKEVVQEDSANTIICLNGGPFNQEVASTISDGSHIQIVYL